MEPEEVRALLRAYRENKSRVAYLETEAEEIRRGVVIENRPETQAIHAQKYDLKPRSSSHSSPTEKLAIWSVDGGKTTLADHWEKEAKQIETELWNVRRDVARVDAWLLGLTDKERAVITAHELDGLPWYKVSFQSESLLGTYMTDGGLRKIGRTAMDKICRIAR